MNNFIKTLKTMKETGEFDRIANSLRKPQDYEVAKGLTRKQRRIGIIECENLKQVDYDGKGITIPLLTYISNEVIWRDIVCLMISDEDIFDAEEKPKTRRRKKADD